MGSSDDPAVVDLNALRRSCQDCSLRTLCLPAGVDIGELDQLDQLVQRPAPLARNQSLFHTGDPFRSIFVVRSGSLKTVQYAHDADAQIMGFHLPGEVLGLDAIATNSHHCDAIALERTSVCAVPMNDIERTASRVPSLQRQLHRIMSREMAHDRAHMAALGRRAARDRLALFLYDLSYRLVQSGHSGTAFQLPMLRDDIANYLGLALETVSRLLNQLADDGLVTIDRRHIRIEHPEKLAQMAGQGIGDPSDSQAER